MPPWLLRGIGMAIVHAAAYTALAKIRVYSSGDADLITVLVLALLVGVAAFWSATDAWLRKTDSGRTWFIGALIAGPVAGILYVIGRAVFVDQTGVSSLGPALFGGAAFTALLVMVPAGLGLLVGQRIQQPHRRLEDKSAPSDADNEHNQDDADQPDTAKEDTEKTDPTPADGDESDAEEYSTT